MSPELAPGAGCLTAAISESSQLLPLYKRTKEGCKTPWFKICDVCDLRWCIIHEEKPTHTCPKRKVEPEDYDRIFETQRADFLLDLKRRSPEIALRAARLRQQTDDSTPVSCTVDVDGSLQGGYHRLMPITFDDGTKWLWRVVRPPVRVPVALETAKVLSEMAAMRLAKEIGIPSPQTHGEAMIDEERQEFSFFLDFLPGGRIKDPLPPSFFIEMAKMYAAIYAHPLPQMGSPSLSPSGEVAVQGCIDRDSPRFREDGTLSLVGPTSSPRLAWREQVERRLASYEDRTHQGQSESSTLGGYLATLALLDLVDILYPPEQEPPSEFFLKHSDSHLANFLFDESGKMTGVIDWEFARIATAEEAFAAPRGLWQTHVRDRTRDPTTLSDDEEKLAQALEAIDQPKLAFHVRNGRKYHCLELCLHNFSWAPFKGLWNLLHPEDPVEVDDWLPWAFDHYYPTHKDVFATLARHYGGKMDRAAAVRMATRLRAAHIAKRQGKNAD